jgi:hypothetical protein
LNAISRADQGETIHGSQFSPRTSASICGEQAVASEKPKATTDQIFVSFVKLVVEENMLQEQRITPIAQRGLRPQPNFSFFTTEITEATEKERIASDKPASI